MKHFQPEEYYLQRKRQFAAAVVLCIGAGLAAISGCSHVDRSRDWSNSAVSGKVLAEQVCSTCHGLDGQSSNSLFPKLAGQQKNYILGQLEAIKGRDRNSEHTRQFMWGPARYITAKQMDEVASYFSEQSPMQASATPGNIPESGAVIYHQGIPSKGVKPCAFCHGNSAEGEDEFPRLAGQHVDYLNSRARIAMTKIVAPLSDSEIKAVSVYLESIGAGGAKPAGLVATKEKVITVATADEVETPKIFDAEGKPGNCHYSVWTYGWYCGSFWDALVYHLKDQ